MVWHPVTYVWPSGWGLVAQADGWLASSESGWYGIVSNLCFIMLAHRSQYHYKCKNTLEGGRLVCLESLAFHEWPNCQCREHAMINYSIHSGGATVYLALP